MSNVDSTVRAVLMIKECESLLASAAFYGAAHQLQQRSEQETENARHGENV